MIRKTSFALTLCALLVSVPQANASFDMTNCQWGEETCLLAGDPVLTPYNDSRDNLLRLLSEAKSFLLPVQALPSDITRSREFYFAVHPQWEEEQTPSTTAKEQSENQTLDQQMIELKIDPLQFTSSGNSERLGIPDYDRENRFVSYTLDAVSQFNAALLADTTLTPEQRHTLALVRIKQFYTTDIQKLSEELNSFPVGSNAHLFSRYITGVAHFYDGDYDAATEAFTTLLKAGQPWLAETAQYMLMRTALNKSSQNSDGQFGEFDIGRINREYALLAQKEAQTYLHSWPEGRYVDSARGMLRRINWYLQEWQPLAGLYEEAFMRAASAQELRGLVSEYDNVIGALFLEQPARESFPGAPLVSYVELLRSLRTDNEGKTALDQELLDASKPVFEESGKLSLWRNLQLNLWQLTGNETAILQAVVPAKTLPPHDILAFSEQVLYGEALMGQKQWPQARDFWLSLLKLSQDYEQQQYLQAKLAATLVYSGDLAAIFAPDSAVTNLRFRSRVLKTQASLDLLRQQAMQGPNSEERTIALHTLLIRDLTENRFDDWLNDKKLIDTITSPVIGNAFDDVDLSVFGWNGNAVEVGYMCRSLDDTVTVLSKNAEDAHALNCLGEFFRNTQARVNLWKDNAGNDALEAAISLEHPRGQYDRQQYYQQIITSSKAEPEDKSFALYRAIMCYAPSGMNDCGGESVDKLQRKGWFTLLKTQFPGSPWAQDLKYYW
ncbi:hypothetical protein NLX76_07310 [Enterobacter hormaechei]|uniref:hypothetical protein n=1 Tax=Enterobacter hormaechei TaxID=158836 RepID=UPI0020B73351|nr:hypothetical protein [Enterobacter hormaechei]MCP3813712.1 hypothetical protein [Enterobacter hormaechei]MCP3823674.1 hypothetical protein [Enterobacter hormaechei]MCW4624987.1 hypothetical protein [Enterobacter hormaechei]